MLSHLARTLGVLVVMLALAARAEAASIRLERTPGENLDMCPSNCIEPGTRAVVVDRPGERNRLTFTDTEDGLLIRDRVRLHYADDERCSRISARAVACLDVSDVAVRTGRGDDRVRVTADLRGDVAIDGGAGDDDLYARGSATLRGGAGDDLLRVGTDSFLSSLLGGAGSDRIDAANDLEDEVRCGAGRDRVRADRDDKLAGCERRATARR